MIILYNVIYPFLVYEGWYGTITSHQLNGFHPMILVSRRSEHSRNLCTKIEIVTTGSPKRAIEFNLTKQQFWFMRIYHFLHLEKVIGLYPFDFFSSNDPSSKMIQPTLPISVTSKWYILVHSSPLQKRVGVKIIRQKNAVTVWVYSVDPKVIPTINDS